MQNIDKFTLISRNTIEIISEDELREALLSERKLTGYIGFEPSGLFHLGWVIWALKVRDLTEAGIKMKILEGTWHAWINDKMKGDLEKIKRVAKYTEYVLSLLGVSNVEYVDAEELVSQKEYWATVIKVSKNTSLARMKRAMTIMGRKAEESEIDASKLIYPAMQVADIFYMDLDIALGGLDQRKAHILAREIAEKFHRKKVIAVHTPLLVGLKGGERMETVDDEKLAELKMSKSKPENAVFLHDTDDEINKKIMSAYCPPKEIEGNPIVDINRYIVLPIKGRIVIERPMKYGGDIEIASYTELEKLYSNGDLHPLDLKRSTVNTLIEIIKPIRDRLEKESGVKELVSGISENISR
ncbi:tyrosine--tRNA ligase [Sulfolobales archaeon HS-7]|nr:tyrosine--tRNA ligase [Sulfolobales archaeon HS-7]